MMDAKEFRGKLDEWEAKISIAEAELEDAQLEVEQLWKKRNNFCRRNCPHTETYTRSVMGRDTEKRCCRCDIEL